MSLMKVRLELARDPEFQEGSGDRGYEFTAPLDENGHIAEAEWKRSRDRCRVRRFWNGEPEEVGHLVRKASGSWAFHYDLLGDPEDDEVGYRFSEHKFKRGEYVSIKEHDNVLRTFRVVMVQPLE